MDFATRWLSVALFSLFLPFAAAGQAPAKPKPDAERPAVVPVDPGKIDINQVREELGVNEFTAPSIEHLLAELMDLRPIPIEKHRPQHHRDDSNQAARYGMVSTARKPAPPRSMSRL